MAYPWTSIPPFQFCLQVFQVFLCSVLSVYIFVAFLNAYLLFCFYVLMQVLTNLLTYLLTYLCIQNFYNRAKVMPLFHVLFLTITWVCEPVYFYTVLNQCNWLGVVCLQIKRKKTKTFCASVSEIFTGPLKILVVFSLLSSKFYWKNASICCRTFTLVLTNTIQCVNLFLWDVV